MQYFIQKPKVTQFGKCKSMCLVYSLKLAYLKYLDM